MGRDRVPARPRRSSGPLYGKIGDLYGRKLVLQTAIVIFLAGSALCGLSQNMAELIAFRALQGLGAGGLIVTTIAVIGDVIPPRERGRYQGFFGAVFGVSTVIGPLLGGFFVDHLSLALDLLRQPADRRGRPRGDRRRLPRPGGDVRHAIDWLGRRRCSPAGSPPSILFTSLGGTTYGWSSPEILALIAIAARAAAAVRARRVARDRADHAARPVPQPDLRRPRARSASWSASLCSGRSPTCRSSSRSSRARARPDRVSS